LFEQDLNRAHGRDGVNADEILPVLAARVTMILALEPKMAM